MEKVGKEKALFAAKKIKSELVFNMAKSEGNTLTYAETEIVLEGTSIAGKPIKDLRQIDNIGRGWDEIINQVDKNTFEVTKDNFIKINSLVAESENLELGRFRDNHVRIGGTKYLPPMPMELNDRFRTTISDFEKNDDVESKSYDLFLDSARNQFFGDGNKRTAQLMMNGYLMKNGYLPISISPENDVEYKEKLVSFYESDDKKEMRAFLGKCQRQVSEVGTKSSALKKPIVAKKDNIQER